MTTEEVKIEIAKIMETLPEQSLLEVLKYLKKLENDRLDKFFDRIVIEDHNLLKRLADS